MKISFVIPCYNEALSIKENIEEKVIPFLNRNNYDYEIILVNDGSTDGTKSVISSIQGAKSISYDKNRGKGGAVKEGILASTGDYVLFMDADLSTDLSAISKIYELASDYDVIIGSRHAKGSVLVKKQPLIRQFVGFACRKLVNLVFWMHYKDTQCGFKAFKREFAVEMAKKQKINGFAFDVEYLYMAKLNKLKTKEIPVIWENDTSSTVKVTSSSIGFLRDMRRIKKNKKNYIFGGFSK